MSIRIPPKLIEWISQDAVDFIDTSLTINDWSQVIADLSEGIPARLWFIILEQTNNGATAEDIELELTINGTTITWSGTLDSGTPYLCYVGYDNNPYLSAGVNSVNNSGYTAQTVPLNCNSVALIRVRQTTDVDLTSAQIEVNIIWDKLSVVNV